MKLEDCLGMYLQNWSSGCLYMFQNRDGSIRDDSGLFVMCRPLLCADWETAKVSEAQYLAARDRLHADAVKEANMQATKEAREIAQGNGKVFSSMEAMTASLTQPAPKPAEWLEIAKDQFHIITKSKTCRETLSFAQAAEFAFDAADAFCAEMEKRK